MRRAAPASIVLVFGLMIGSAFAVLAHQGTGVAEIQAEPSSVTAGNTIILAGSGLEPDNERVLVLAGEGLTVEFGTVTTDAEGMFSKELTIPSHLPSGNYELRAIGDETLVTALAVTAAAGGAVETPAANAANETVRARDRSPLETSSIFVFVAIAAALGALIVVRAEWFGSRARG
jgi:hypothetical protein